MRALVVAGLLSITIGHATSARPCGALFRSEVDQNLAIDAQRALVILRASTVEMHLQLHAATGGADFAWIIPVPGVPSLALGDQAIFDALDRMTTPEVEIVAESGGGGGGFCGSDALKGDGGLHQDGVQHFGGGRLGDYAYDIIAGQTAEAIEGWLDMNGYTLPDDFATTVAPYVNRASFVAVKLAPGTTTIVDPDPLVVTFPRPFDASLTYPLGMSRLSTIGSAPVVLWVFADKRYRVANFASAELRMVAEVMREQADRGDAVSYADAVTTLTSEAGGRLAITEYAQDLTHGTGVESAIQALVDGSAYYLTRLYMDVPRADIEDLVVTFAANAPDVAPFATAQGEAHVPLTAACVALALLVIGRSRRP